MSREETLRELGGLQGAARTSKGAGLPRAGFKILLAHSEALPDVSEALPAGSKALPASFKAIPKLLDPGSLLLYVSLEPQENS